MPRQTTITNINTIIGVGIKEPVEFSSNSNNQLLELETGIKKINQSIKNILDTGIGERYNNPEYGAGLRSVIFEQNDMILRDMLYYLVKIALERWERRITLLSITFSNPDAVDVSEHQINITISYLINTTHVIGSFVYPFVKNAMPMSQVVQGKSSIQFNNFF